jgi:hypothetical protein
VWTVGINRPVQGEKSVLSSAGSSRRGYSVETVSMHVISDDPVLFSRLAGVVRKSSQC